MSKPKHLKREDKRKQIKSTILANPELSNRAIARICSCSPTTVGTIKSQIAPESVQFGHMDTELHTWKNHPYLKQHPELLDGLSDKGLRAIKCAGVLDKMQERQSTSPVYCQRLINRQLKAARKSANGIVISESDIQIKQSDIRDGLSWIPSKSVDLIVTDPLYHEAAIPLYGHLSAFAARVLKDTGSLIVLCGNNYLPEFMQQLTKHMRYWWTLAYMTPSNGSPQLQWKRVATYWKPAVWLVPKNYTGDMVYDVIKTPHDAKHADKAHHEYGQSIEGIGEIIERLSAPGQVICDPFVGGGSTAIAAIKAHRKFIGSDIDSECVRITKQRVHKLMYGDNGNG